MPAVQDSIDAIRIAAAAADRMKATDLVAFDVTEPLAITDAMLVATASNERQVLAVAEEIEKDLYLKSGKRQPRSREGLTEGQWVLLDYGDFVIHVMHQESRDFYRLERLWKDCPAARTSGDFRRRDRGNRGITRMNMPSRIDAEGMFSYQAKQFSQTFHNRESNGEQQHASKRRT